MEALILLAPAAPWLIVMGVLVRGYRRACRFERQMRVDRETRAWQSRDVEWIRMNSFGFEETEKSG